MAAELPVPAEARSVWDELVARLRDDGVRGVLADLLQTAGDPRGELVALQLLPTDDDRAFDRRDRIQALLAAHGRDWLGPLAPIAGAARFERGFVGRIELAYPWPATDRRWGEVAGSEWLATVEDLLHNRLHSDGHEPEVYALLARSPRMVNLRRVELIAHKAVVGAVRDSRAPIEHVAVLEAQIAPGVVEFALGQRASVTSIGAAATVVEQLAPQPWFERIVEVTVACGVRRGLALWPRLPHVRRLGIASSPGLESCTALYPWDHRVELAREDGGVVARVSGEWLLHPIDALEALPADVTRVEVEHASDLIAERVRAIAAPRGIAVSVRRASWHGGWAPPDRRG